MPISNLENVKQLPRLGKIRLGYMQESKTGKKKYPKEAGYFILDPEVEGAESLIAEFKQLYGEKPKAIKIMFPVDDPAVFFPQYYKMYKKYGDTGILCCKGDGRTALRLAREGGGLEEQPCDGENCDDYIAKSCRRLASLQVLLPELPGIGCWQLSTTSRRSIININSAVDIKRDNITSDGFIRSMCGRVAMIPLTLELVEEDTQRLAADGPKITKHHILHIDAKNVRLADLQRQAQIPTTQIALPAPDENRDELLYSGDDSGIVEDAVVGEEGNSKPGLRAPQAKNKTTATTTAKATTKKKEEFDYKVEYVASSDSYIVHKLTLDGEHVITYTVDMDPEGGGVPQCSCPSRKRCHHIDRVAKLIASQPKSQTATTAWKPPPKTPAPPATDGKGDDGDEAKLALPAQINSIAKAASQKVIGTKSEDIKETLQTRKLTFDQANRLLKIIPKIEQPLEIGDWLKKVIAVCEMK